MIGGIGPTEIIIVLAIALLVLGPKRLPDTAKSMGRGIREFKDSIAGRDRDGDVLTETIDPATDRS
jgi:sec-independent protein translocase protein TatA